MKTESLAERREIGTLVCFALNEEAAPFRKMAREIPNVHILVTGIGRQNAEAATRKFFARHLPKRVFTCGFTGGLNPKLVIGDVLFSTGHHELEELLADAGAVRSHFVCTDRIATTVAEKKKLRDETGADAVEMESDAILNVCRESQIPCAILRAISDTANEDLPLDFNALSKPDKSIHFGKLAWAIVKSPWKIGALLALHRKTSFAARHLAEVLERITFS